MIASAGAVTVDTVLTPALVAEGLASECLSILQQARKDAGLEVADRIPVTWASAEAAVAAAISNEALAVSCTEGPGATTADFNGHALAFTLTKR